MTIFARFAPIRTQVSLCAGIWRSLQQCMYMHPHAWEKMCPAGAHEHAACRASGHQQAIHTSAQVYYVCMYLPVFMIRVAYPKRKMAVTMHACKYIGLICVLIEHQHKRWMPEYMWAFCLHLQKFSRRILCSVWRLEIDFDVKVCSERQVFIHLRLSWMQQFHKHLSFWPDQQRGFECI